MNSPPAMSCQSRTKVSENGTMKAALVERPAISQRAMPASRLAQNGALRRIARGCHFTIALASFQTLGSTSCS